MQREFSTFTYYRPGQENLFFTRYFVKMLRARDTLIDLSDQEAAYTLGDEVYKMHVAGKRSWRVNLKI